MIGNYIKGIDNNGKECKGIVLDKVRVLQTISMKAPNAPIGAPTQTMPVPLDAYLVISPDDTLHLVSPNFITAFYKGMPAPNVKPLDPELMETLMRADPANRG